MERYLKKFENCQLKGYKSKNEEEIQKMILQCIADVKSENQKNQDEIVLKELNYLLANNLSNTYSNGYYIVCYYNKY